MTTAYHIDATPLPLSQDFAALKKEGIAYIQNVNGSDWTNLNASDPGVTILEQLCFALTELGYCANFPIQDLLTHQNGELMVKDLFYLPDEIFTTAPVTIDDYRKYIIDAFPLVENVVVLALQSRQRYIKGKYAVYLSIDPKVTDTAVVSALCRSVFYHLHQCRNLGELFLVPQPLQRLTCALNGQLEVANARDIPKIMSQLQHDLRQFVFPKALQQDEQQLTRKNQGTDEIFNGPDLKNGWFDKQGLGAKIDVVHLRDLTNIILGVAGITAVRDLKIAGTTDNTVQCNPQELLVFDLSQLLVSGKQTPTAQTLESATSNLFHDYQQMGTHASFGASEKKRQDLPQGQFRDINAYYSIQNTFPSIYAVGANAIDANASDFQIAQSRQLKGYLTLFDQVLANQFSQLANIPRLFSFKNSLCGTPSDLQKLYARKSQTERENTEYPVPFLTFSPTYFYQSLYEVPDIKPLLKSGEVVYYDSGLQSKSEALHHYWKAYQQNPYNQYIKGLMDLMEDEAVNLDRRNNMLDHLLARHGESPLVIDTFIQGSVYSGDAVKDQVIFKSLYLQNLGKLSYARQKAYDCLRAAPIQTIEPVTTEALELQLAAAVAALDPDWHKKKNIRAANDYTTDFIFNAPHVDEIEKIKKKDLTNHATIELKLNLLFGLRMLYVNHLVDLVNEPIAHEQMAICNWFMTQRKGCIAIENALLRPCGANLSVKNQDGLQYVVKSGPDHMSLMQLSLLFAQARSIQLTTQTTGGSSAPVAVIRIDETVEIELEPSLKPIPENDWTPFPADPTIWFALEQNPDPIDDESATLELILPDFIPYFNTAAFRERLDLFLTHSLPVEVSFNCRLMSLQLLKKFIPAFVDWHNALRDSAASIESVVAHSQLLLSLLDSPEQNNHG
ncbi:hypothetical protein [Flavobacterium sp.]|uniref:hypothetical protein n=1 Tax=Flavobacterium sp. TaxID=239 RepID=UPI0039E46D41